MSGLHVVKIAKRLVTEINIVVAELFDEVSEASMLRDNQKPYVSGRKRVSGRGREESLMRINEGITVVPMAPRQAGGTNERDDVAYRFLISIVGGTRTDDLDENWPLGHYEQGIRQRFQHRRIGSLGLADSWEIRCFVEPGELPDWAKLTKEELDSTHLILSCFVREARRVPN